MRDERSCVLLKPGTLERRLVAEVMGRLERKGLRLIAIKMMKMTPEMAAEHYRDHRGKHFYEPLMEFITAGPIIAMAWEGREAVELVRMLCGPTSPLKAAPGTIRGDFCLSTRLNIIHASDSPESARRELSLFFKDNELFPWEDTNDEWITVRE